MTAVATRRAGGPASAFADLADPTSSMSLLEIIRLIWRRKLLVGSIVAVGSAIAVAIALGLQPRYAATTQLLLDPRQEAPSATRNLPAGFALERGGILSEIEILRSPALAEKVLDHLQLWSDPEFSDQPEALGGTLCELPDVRELCALFAIRDQDQIAPTKEIELRRRMAALEAFRSNIAVRPLGSSFVVEVRFESVDPEKAARVANAIAEIYIAEVIKARHKMVLKRRDWLNERVEELRQRVMEAERDVADMIVRRGIVEIGQLTVTDRQITEASAELMRARARRAEVAARLGMVDEALASGHGVESLTEVQGSGLIQRLKEQEAVVLRKIGELSSQFGERYPKLAEARSELADLHKKIREETERIVNGLRNEYRIAEAQVASLTEALAKLKEERARPVRDQVELRELEREAALSRKLYEDFLAKLNLTAQEGTLQESNAQIISPAQPPVEPSSPRTFMIVALGLTLSGGLAVGLVLLIERLGTGFRTPDQVEGAAQLALLGTVPRAGGSRNVADLVLSEKNSGYAEAIRSLRTALSVSGPKGPPQVLLIASSLSGEGKTSLGISLARQAAQALTSGSVILIDCDLRRPSVAATVGVDGKKGLLDLFSREARLEDVIQEDPKTGLHIIPAASGTQNPPELLNSLHMRDLLKQLKQKYDLIVLDSPALSAVSDARVLAQLADATVFVVQWEKTPRSVALAALRQLQSAGAAIAGVVLHKVNSRNVGLYGYSATG